MIESNLNSQWLYREKEVTSLLSVSPSTLSRWVKAGEFPAPIRLSSGISAWEAASIANWVALKRSAMLAEDDERAPSIEAYTES